jgi:hypothetical protein
MESEPKDLVSECSLEIAGSAEIVWQSLRNFRAILQPDGIIEYAPMDGDRKTGASLPSPQPSVPGSMRQRVIEVDDKLMILRLEMTAGRDVPWSSYQSQLRVEPCGPDRCRTTMTCLVRPTTDRQFVDGTLRGLISLSLLAIKHRFERPD